MGADQKGPSAGPFELTRLPWLVGGAGLLLYLVTLNHWISLQSLGVVARVSGWLWEPQLGRPLTVAFFFPFRFFLSRWRASEGSAVRSKADSCCDWPCGSWLALAFIYCFQSLKVGWVEQGSGLRYRPTSRDKPRH